MRLRELLCEIFHIKPRYREGIENGIFVLEGEITNDSAYDLISKIILYTETSADEITLYINSKGGLVSAGFAIYDVLRAVSNEIKVICVKNTSGIALLIASTGMVNKRFYFSGTRITLGGFSADASANTFELENTINGVIEKYFLCLAENTGVSEEELRLYTKNKKLSKDILLRMGFVKC